MKRLTLALASMLYLFVSMFVLAPVALAEDKKCAETSFSFNASKNNAGTNCVTIRDLVVEVFRFLSIMVGVLAVGGYAYAGIIYSTSGGNPGQTQKAITIMANTTLGVVGFFGLYGFILFLIPGNVLR